MDNRHVAITIATLAWQLIEEVKKEDDRSKVAFTQVHLGANDEAHYNSVRFFIDNDIVEPTDIEGRYILTQWFFDAMKLYLQEYYTKPPIG